MRLGNQLVVLAVVVALGCDEGRGPLVDGGGQPGTDSGPRADAGGDPEDGGATDAGLSAPDGGPMSCSTTLPALGYEEIAPGAWGGRLPIGVVQPPGEDEDLYVIDQRGEILIVRDGAILPTPFLDLTDDVNWGGADGDERGLLGLAFHPDYATNGRFFVYYSATESTMRNIVAEYHASGDVADPGETRLVDIRDPETNHNGGMMAFGPDGRLYVGTGDGGGGGDRHGAVGNGQNLDTLLGKILRLDVDRSAQDFAAAGNPFGPATTPPGLPQIWAYGLRNPWRFSFDRLTGDLWIGDVGQESWEEIDFQPASSPGGENYGWRGYEGMAVFDRDIADATTNHTPPVFVFSSGFTPDPILPGSCSATGGYVYRGSAIPSLQGWYLFGDFCSGSVAALRRCDGEIVGAQRVPGLSSSGNSGLSSFGQDNAGELYTTGFLFEPPYVRRIVAR